MAANPLNPTARYIPPGVRQYYFVPTFADYKNPQRTELDAGTDLTSEIAAVDGFVVTSDTVDAPDLGTRFTAKVPGRTSADDSSITLYLSKEGDDARTLLSRDATGFVVQFPEGDVDGGLMDVFPVTVAASTVLTDLEDPGRLQVSFTITAEPATNVTIPASS